MAVRLATLAFKKNTNHNKNVLNFLTFKTQKSRIMNSTATAIEKSSCVFCNIANKLENTEILFEDEDVCVFRDIKPASDYHILTIPKRHIEDAKCLTSADKDLVQKMLTTAKDLLSKNNLSPDDARFGYHWPPFRSVRHLHLHTIAPESKMGLIGKMIFMKNSYWFASPDYVEIDCDNKMKIIRTCYLLNLFLTISY